MEMAHSEFAPPVGQAGPVVLPSDLPSTDEERERRRRQQFQIPASVYLEYSPGEKQVERNALAVLMGLEDPGHAIDKSLIFDHVLHEINRHCPRLLANQALLKEFLLLAGSKTVDCFLARFDKTISWSKELALIAIHRSHEHYKRLPDDLQIDDDVLLLALERGMSPTKLDRTVMKWKTKDFVIKAIQLNPWVITRCYWRLVKDTDVLLEATRFGDTSFFTWTHCPKKYKVIKQFSRAVYAKLELMANFQSFLTCISVAGATVVRDGDDYSPLHIFHCGEETSVALKRHIADFLGAPTDGVEVSKWKQSWATVSKFYSSQS